MTLYFGMPQGIFHTLLPQNFQVNHNSQTGNAVVCSSKKLGYKSTAAAACKQIHITITTWLPHPVKWFPPEGLNYAANRFQQKANHRGHDARRCGSLLAPIRLVTLPRSIWLEALFIKSRWLTLTLTCGQSTANLEALSLPTAAFVFEIIAKGGKGWNMQNKQQELIHVGVDCANDAFADT